MPRRPPGEIRARLPYRVNRGSRTVIRGLSSSANRQIAQFERKKRLHRGDVAYAFRAWSEVQQRGSGGAEPCYGYGTTAWHDMHARTLLESVMHTMSPKAQRQLAAAMNPLDNSYLACTVNDPFRPGGLALVAQEDPHVTPPGPGVLTHEQKSIDQPSTAVRGSVTVKFAFANGVSPFAGIVTTAGPFQILAEAGQQRRTGGHGAV